MRKLGQRSQSDSCLLGELVHCGREMGGCTQGGLGMGMVGSEPLVRGVSGIKASSNTPQL